MLATAGNGDLKQTIAGIYGLSTAKKMLKIEGKDLDFELFGYVSLPEDHQWTFYQELFLE